MKTPARYAFAKESDLCAAFISILPAEWTAYPETGGFDILLVRNADGFQIGVEAKLKLNAKVICQAAEPTSTYQVNHPGPDCRAVLIPDGVSMDLAALCPRLALTIIRVRHDSFLAQYRKTSPFTFHPNLPKNSEGRWGTQGWYELCPAERIALPDWVPDVAAGNSAPVALTDWKVRAIKIAITLEKRGYVTRADFAFFEISMSRWTQSRWIVPGNTKGRWIAGRMPDFRAQHPVNFTQIEADHEKWRDPKLNLVPNPEQSSLTINPTGDLK